MKRSLLFLLTALCLLYSQSLTDSLKAYYPFSGNANDESGNGLDAVNFGALPVSDRFDSLNCAYSFNGSTNYMMIGNPVPGELQIQNEITLSAWIYLTSYPGPANLGLIIGSQTDYTMSGASIFISGIENQDGQPCPPGHVHFQIGDGSWHSMNTDNSVPLNQWVLITATRKANEAGKIYYNNVLQPSTSVSWNGNIAYNSAWMMIGRQQDYGDRYFNGKIDEARVYNRALTEDEIDQLYANYLPPENFAGRAEEGRNVLSWDTNGYADLQKIKVYRDGLFCSELGVDGPEDSIYFDKDVVPGTAYTYTISSVDNFGNESIRTNSVNVTAIEITFTDINAGLPTLNNSTADWGDYDNDGDLDILLTGYAGSAVSKIYRNNAGVFTDINAGLTGVLYASCAWGDFDNDGDLDIILSGAYDLLYNSVSKIYRNDEGIFIDINAGLLSVCYSSVEWGDYDNDGDLDILLTGNTGTNSAPVPISKVYRNNGDGIFTDINAGLYGVYRGPANWGDFDNDGDLDILLAGADGSSNYLSKIYRNDGNGVFTDINAGLEGVYMSSADWGDYDSDGDLDILIAGYNGSVRTAKIYNNNSGVFTDIEAGLIGKQRGSSAWGDYDNDGDLDLIITGLSVSEGNISKIYRNNAGVFIDIGAGLSATTDNITVWGDYDDDGDLDILMSNNFESAEVYRNNSGVQNSVPSKPALLSADLEKSLLKFSISPGLDTETPQAGLSYNYHIEIDSMIVKPSMADTATGLRRIAMIGNASQNNFYDIDIRDIILPQEGKVLNLSWKVQAIDHCFAGSEFAGIDTTVASYDLKVIKYDQMEAGDLLTWEYAFPDSIADYQLQLDDDINFSSPVEEILTIDRKKDSKIVNYNVALNELTGFDSLISNTRYYWRVKPNYTYRTGRYPAVPASFIYNPTYSIPSPVSIAVEGNYVTLEWGTGKEGEKSMLYNVYSSDDPHAVFPEGWTLVNSVTGTSYLMNSSAAKKFYCVTAAGSVK